jgi:MFS superfamily sulfate permease-like transporter
VAAVVIAIVVLFFTQPFSQLPDPILAAVVLVAIKGLINIPALQAIRQVSRPEFRWAVATILGVLCFGILEGVLLGVIFSILSLLKQAAYPHTAVLGRVPGTEVFSDIERHPENEQSPGVLIYRVDSMVFYANAATIKQDVLARVDYTYPPINLVVLDLSHSPGIDLTGTHMLQTLHNQLTSRRVALRLAGASGLVRDRLRAPGLRDRFGVLGPDTTISAVLRDWQQAGEQL